jgi:hypothetical protein
MKRVILLATSVALAISAAWIVATNHAAIVLAANTPTINLNVQNAAPRQIEDATQKAVARDYAAAWQTMTDALDQNRTDLLAANFIGTATDKLAETIHEQSQTGLHRRYTDKGHQVQATFYSTEGSAMELHDTAQLHVEVLDGSKVVHSEDVTIHYVALMTAAENSWKVRVLQEVPSF